MRRRLTAILGYGGAGLVVSIAACVPFVLLGFFADRVAKAGLQVDPIYSGGSVARTVVKPGYRIIVYQPVRPHFLQRVKPFVQIAWEPVTALPGEISDEVDLDGDGRPDVHVAFACGADAGAVLRVDVTALNNRYESLAGVGKESFSKLIARGGRRIIVRIPLHGEAGSAR